MGDDVLHECGADVELDCLYVAVLNRTQHTIISGLHRILQSSSKPVAQNDILLCSQHHRFQSI